MKIIPHNKPTIGFTEKRAVKKVLKSKWIANGDVTKQFEKEFAKYLGDGRWNKTYGTCVAVDSGTSALHLALLGLGIGYNKKPYENVVILPTYSCSALLNAVRYVNATPLILDINDDDFNISEKDLLKLLDNDNFFSGFPQTQKYAIIIQHTFGTPFRFTDELLKKLKKRNVKIIEDCTHAIGAKYGFQKCGTFGDIAIWSFGATKQITTGKGGMVYSEHPDIIERIRALADYDFLNRDYNNYEVLYNYKMCDFNASLGLAPLKRIDYLNSCREYIAEKYNKGIRDANCIEDNNPVWLHNGNENYKVYYRYVIVIDDNLQSVIDRFDNRMIAVINPMWATELLHNRLGLDKNNYPNAEATTKQSISLPIYPTMKDKEIKRVCNGVKEGLK